MALDVMSGLNKMNPTGQVGGVKPQDKVGQGSQGLNAPGGLDFKKALDEIAAKDGAKGVAQAGLAQSPQGVTAPNANAAVSSLKFSNHALERMHSRGISFGADEMKGIENAVTKAAQKGSKDTLVLSGDNALIVSVKNHTIVTVMDRAAMKDNVFTNIDSTVVL